MADNSDQSEQDIGAHEPGVKIAVTVARGMAGRGAHVGPNVVTVLLARIDHLTALLADREAMVAGHHRVCIAQEHDPAHGKVHGTCVICAEGWPCAVEVALLSRYNVERVE